MKHHSTAWERYTLAELVKAIGVGGEDESAPPNKQTEHLFYALVDRGWMGRLLQGDLAGNAAPPFHSNRHPQNCLSWKGEVLNARGETFDQIADGRYPGLPVEYEGPHRIYTLGQPGGGKALDNSSTPHWSAAARVAVAAFEIAQSLVPENPARAASRRF